MGSIELHRAAETPLDAVLFYVPAGKGQGICGSQPWNL